MTEDEWRAYEDELSRLDRKGEVESAERLVRRTLGRLPRDDARRGPVLTSLSLIQMRRGQFHDALASAMEAVRFAHSRGEIGYLAYALDQRAQVKCFLNDFAGAIRTLQEARRFLDHGALHNSELNAALDHTWGMAYRGCGWWDAADRAMARVTDYHEYKRQWPEWALAFGDRVVTALGQAEAEGPDADRLRRLSEPFAKAREFLSGNVSFTIQSAIHALHMRECIARAADDFEELRRARDEYTDLVLTYDGPRRPLSDPKLLGHRVAIALATARLDRALIAGRRDVGHDPDDLLRRRARILTLAVDRVVRPHELLRERAMVTLARARRGHFPWSQAVADAAHDLSTAVYHVSDYAAEFSDPGLRAGWLGHLGRLLCELAEAASAALREATPPLPDAALRLLGLAQTLRARARDDIVRSLEYLHAGGPEARDVADLLARIRSLNRWLELLDETDETDDRSPCRGMKNVKVDRGLDEPLVPASTLAEFVRAIEAKYSEYAHFRVRGDVSAELNRTRERLKSLADRHVAVRARLEGAPDGRPDLACWRAELPMGHVVLDYLLGPWGTSVAVLGREVLDIIPLPLPDLATLRRLIETHLTPDDADSTGWEHRDRLLTEGVRKCGEWLMPPRVVDAVANASAKYVHVVASGPLWRVPFGWLPAGDRLVMERWGVCLTPSARMASVRMRPGVATRAVAVAHPGTPPLPNIAAEARLVAAVLGGSVVSDEAATPQRVLDDLVTKAGVLHFGCHGTADPVTPWLASLHLSPDGRHLDGRLMLYEILERRCAADLVDLAACYTGRTEGPISFPESLAHAWLGAGARFVIASLWPANDSECLAFAGDFYGEYRASRDAMGSFHSAPDPPARPRQGQRAI